MKKIAVALSLLIVASHASAQEMHDHGAPEKLGTVSFPISCAPSVQAEFNRGVALMHSFAYTASEQAFRNVASMDPKCAMAHWGVAMTYFHQVWGPMPANFAAGQKEAFEAQSLGAGSDRERGFIQAMLLVYEQPAGTTPVTRVARYKNAMAEVARSNPNDVESQVFYALALLADAPPTDKTHSDQKLAVDVLEPLYRKYPDHPGLAHYLIHACDSQELAQRGLPAARAYAQIAPSVPHALHMPSHTFTRLGLWDDSIRSNVASWQAAREQGDMQAELHAMDYLVYAYLQTGRDQDAACVLADLKTMQKLDMTNSTVAYAATVMPVRVAVERQRWADAAAISVPAAGPPSAIEVAVWSRGLGLAHTGHVAEAREEADRLRAMESQLSASGDSYWATQAGVLAGEVTAWSLASSGHPQDALEQLRKAADAEDAVEKLPLTPGPVLPAREQLGDMLLQQDRPALALREFQTALAEAPGRQGALLGLAHASELTHRAQGPAF